MFACVVCSLFIVSFLIVIGTGFLRYRATPPSVHRQLKKSDRSHPRFLKSVLFTSSSSSRVKRTDFFSLFLREGLIRVRIWGKGRRRAAFVRQHNLHGFQAEAPAASAAHDVVLFPTAFPSSGLAMHIKNTSIGTINVKIYTYLIEHATGVAIIIVSQFKKAGSNTISRRNL